jgi:hypothetical protein
LKIIEFQHFRPGKGDPFVRTKLRRAHGRALHQRGVLGGGEHPRRESQPAPSIRAPDSDGVRDVADDQDQDDIPNLAEMSRNMAIGISTSPACRTPAAARARSTCRPRVRGRRSTARRTTPTGSDPNYLVLN